MSKRASDLSINEKYILHYVINTSSKGKDFYQNNTFLARVLDMTEKSAGRLVYNLIKKEYIVREKLDVGRYRLTYTGKIFEPLAVYPKFKDINDKVNIQEIDEWKEKYENLLIKYNSLKNELKELKNK